MKLSKREMDLILNIPVKRKKRLIGAWVGLLTLIACIAAAMFFDFDIDALIPTLAVFAGMVASELGNQYLGFRTGNRLEELLLKFVNGDAETIRQMSEYSMSREIEA